MRLSILMEDSIDQDGDNVSILIENDVTLLEDYLYTMGRALTAAGFTSVDMVSVTHDNDKVDTVYV